MHPQADEDVKEDLEFLSDYSLVHETSGTYYSLHDLTHEYLQLHTKMTPEVISTAVSRQVRFIVAPETLRAYSQSSDDSNTSGGLYLLVKLWITIKKLDQSRVISKDVMEVPQASTDWSYMKEAGDLLTLVVRIGPNNNRGLGGVERTRAFWISGIYFIRAVSLPPLYREILPALKRSCDAFFLSKKQGKTSGRSRTH